jgi:hypothetical protein
VPRLLGQTEAARQANGRPEGRRWDRDSVLRELNSKRGKAERDVASRIVEWAERRGDLRLWFGSGQKDGSFQAGLDDASGYLFPFALYTYGTVEVQFQWMLRRPPFDAHERRVELQQKLNTIPGVEIPDDGLDKRPSIPLEALTDASALGAFLSAMDWSLSRHAPPEDLARRLASLRTPPIVRRPATELDSPRQAPGRAALRPSGGKPGGLYQTRHSPSSKLSGEKPNVVAS